jgi:hypothetical protein
MSLRPPAVPLVTVDPNFSIWSTADRLYDDFTRHWTLARQSLVGLVRIDGKCRRFLGKSRFAEVWRHRGEPSGMRQESVEVSATTSTYLFADLGVELSVRFTTPLLLDDLEVLSRPFSYVEMALRAIDGGEHDVQVYFDATGELCVNHPEQKVEWSRQDLGDGLESQYMGTWTQNVLGTRGDDVRIDWGFVHLIAPDAAETRTGRAAELRDHFADGLSLGGEDLEHPPRGIAVEDGYPAMAAVFDLGKVGADRLRAAVVLGYDDIAAIDYFHLPLAAYCFREGATFEQIAVRAVEEMDELLDRCTAFDLRLEEDAERLGGPEYADIVALAYRQSIAAAKLVADSDGKVLFFSKECFSNGCIATVDVSYPSTPLYLLYNPELVAGMLRPVFHFAASEDWPVGYAPHDVGTYPRANGQVYGIQAGRINFERQMPVEECGNMLIMTAAYTLIAGDESLAEANWDLLESWAEYLERKGFDPENQLCTDDFAGHLAHNTNLSIKAIVGLACFGELCRLTGRSQKVAHFADLAQELAKRWIHEAGDGDHYRLTFPGKGTWSLKYNLIWDQLFSLDLFPDSVAASEVATYIRRKNRYGTPLDSRADFTKTDWLVWAAALAKGREDFASLVAPIWDFCNETPCRTPFCDWYGTVDALEHSFHNRSVIGGVFMGLLKARLVRDWPS